MLLTELLSRQGTRYRLADGGQEVAICCLFCQYNGEPADTRYRLYLNLSGGQGICFNCGWKSKYAIQQVLRRLRLPQDVQLEAPNQEAAPPPKLPEDFTLLCKAKHGLDLRALNYVRKRGITDEQIKAKFLGVSFVGEFAYRVLFPILDHNKLYGLTGRQFMGTPSIKYRHARGEKHLYNLGERKRLILSEGVFKALRIEQLHKPYASAACLGHSLSASQLAQIQAHGVEVVVLWPDPDSAGLRGFLGIAEQLQQAGLPIEVVWPVTQPADEAPLEDMQRCWESRKPYGWLLARKLALAAKGLNYNI